MLTYEEAKRVVEIELAKLEPLPDEDAWVIFSQRTIERAFGWVFFYGSRLYSETGDFQYAIAGNAPLIVNRLTSAIVPTGTARSTEHYIAEYEASLERSSSNPSLQRTASRAAELDLQGLPFE